MKRKEMKELALLKGARQKTRAISNYSPIPIYLEADGPYSMKFPDDRKVVFCVAVNKSGAEYHIGKVHNVCTGGMGPGYVKA